MNTTHELKTNDEFMRAIAIGLKPFEVRKDDRNFNLEDRLLLRGGNLDDNLNFVYSGKVLEAEITYVLPGGQFGIEDGYCVLGIKVMSYNF